MSGYIKFSSAIIEETMSVPPLNIHRRLESTLPETENVFVNMGSISEKQFADIGDTAGGTDFSLQINNTFCATKVRVTFSGIPSAAGNGMLATTNPSVGIQLYDEGGKLALDNGREYVLQPGTNVFRFSSKLVSIKDKVIAGHLDALAMFYLSYM